MGLEAVTYITDLVETNPDGAVDPKSQGDEHLRNIKKAIKNSFPGVVKRRAVFETITELKALAPPTVLTFAFVLGYEATGDGGGGIYWFDVASSATVIQGVVVQPNAGGVGRWKLQHGGTVHVKQCGAKGDWDGTTGTDDTTAIRAALSALSLAVVSVVSFSGGRYRTHSGVDTAALGSFLNFTRSITLDFSNSEIYVDKSSWTVGQRITLFEFNNCSAGVQWRGNGKFSAPAGVGLFDRGPHLVDFKVGCSKVRIDPIRVENFSYGVRCIKDLADPVTYQTKDVQVAIDAVDTYYPLVLTDSGSRLKAKVVGQNCGRLVHLHVDGASVANHLHDVHLEISNKNHQASASVLLQLANGGRLSNVYVEYEDLETTTTDLTLNHVLYELKGSACYLENARTSLNIRGGNTGYSGFGLQVRKVDNSNVADTVDRGHVIRNFSCRGTIRSTTVSQRSISFCAEGVWGNAEYVDQIHFHDLRLEGTGQPNFTLSSLNGVALFDNVVAADGLPLNITGALNTGVALGKVVCTGCDTGYFTTDTTKQVYTGCVIRTPATQNYTNKTVTG